AAQLQTPIGDGMEDPAKRGWGPKDYAINGILRSGLMGTTQPYLDTAISKQGVVMSQIETSLGPIGAWGLRGAQALASGRSAVPSLAGLPHQRNTTFRPSSTVKTAPLW
ncbi:hypothetical protein EBT31_10990, partial [bacterium]|nr:hypothetical protein [bacterium]